MALGALLGPLYGGGFWVAFRQLAAVRPLAAAAACRLPPANPAGLLRAVWLLAISLPWCRH